jgi:hypothetical protein
LPTFTNNDQVREMFTPGSSPYLMPHPTFSDRRKLDPANFAEPGDELIVERELSR